VSIEVLHLICFGHRPGGPADFCLHKEHGVKLTYLKLWGIHFRFVDLSSSSSLISVDLSSLDTLSVPCSVQLPVSLRELTFIGGGLYDCVDFVEPFARLRHLTNLTFGPSSATGGDDNLLCISPRSTTNGLICIPKLPCILRCLRVVGPPSSIRVFDWQCLTECTSLEQLTLPHSYHLSGQLEAWVKSVRHLRVDRFG